MKPGDRVFYSLHRETAGPSTLVPATVVSVSAKRIIIRVDGHATVRPVKPERLRAQ